MARFKGPGMKRLYLYNRINALESCVYVDNPSYGLLEQGSSLAELAQYLTQPQFGSICERLEASADELESVEVTRQHHSLQEYGRN